MYWLFHVAAVAAVAAATVVAAAATAAPAAATAAAAAAATDAAGAAMPAPRFTVLLFIYDCRYLAWDRRSHFNISPISQFQNLRVLLKV